MSGLDAALAKMRAEGLGEAALESFAHYYEQLRAGASGMLREGDLEPVAELPALDDLPEDPDAPLDQAIVLKLNGGLGTSMGMTRAKSLLEVKDGLSFLDVIARQVLGLRARTGARLPLVLMNSFATRADSLAALRSYPELEADVPLDFLQNRVPKLLADTLEPVSWPADPELEWAPPGHGDLYVALRTSGMLEALLDRGYRYAFVSNSDNLGAVLEPRVLGWMAREQIPFVMEAAARTPADRKGGHLARRRDGGGLVLRESAQTAPQDAEAFQDVSRHRFFNANTLWVDLRGVADALDARGALGLPMIVNRKTVDPTDPASPAVIQLETAMGAAIDVFEGARAIRVPRSRFVPVKTTNDLLVLRSDCYRLADDARMELVSGPPLVDLDARYYKLLADFDARFQAGAPSLVECERLVVAGDVTFGAGVVVRGDVRLQGPARIAAGAEIESR
ncbi:MAG TPA: UTP--glucose-1-phosphate uridylyltransferase [Baekduia sp.]|nr:UTP--glucose-1-phosphate uridylyltransferase [Baekduia sp.]